LILKKINKTILITFVKIALSAAVLIFLFNFIDSKDLFASLEKANFYLIAAAVMLMFLNLYLQFSRWELACGHILNERSRKKIFLSLFHGFPAGAVTPGRIGEYFARGIALPDNSASKIALCVFIEKLFPLIPIFLFGLLSFAFFLEINTATILLASLLPLAFVYVFISKIPRLFQKFADRKIFRRTWIKKILDEAVLVRKLEKNFIVKMILLSCLFYACYIIQYAVLVSAFSGNVYLLKYLWAGSLLFFIKAFIPPLTYGDLGIREGVSVYFITKLGETAVAGLNASLFLFLVNLVIPSLAGAVLLFYPKNLKK
jgi:uncharacterized protein (TIRG00374 family)